VFPDPVVVHHHSVGQPPVLATAEGQAHYGICGRAVALARSGRVRWSMTMRPDPRFASYRHPAEIIATAVWLYYRFPLSLQKVEEMLAARGITVSDETIRQWGLKFIREIANRLCFRAPQRAEKWHLDEVVLTIGGKHDYLWRAVDRDGYVMYVLVPSQRNKTTAERLLRKPFEGQGRERKTKRFKSARQVQHVLSINDQIDNLFYLRRDHSPVADYRAVRAQIFETWEEVTGAKLAA